MLLKRRTTTSSNVAEGRLNQKDPWKAAEYEGCVGRRGVRYISSAILS